jgi:hypothetical protein
MAIQGNQLAVKAGGDINPYRFISGGAADAVVLESNLNDIVVLGVTTGATREAPRSGASVLHAADGDNVEYLSAGMEASVEAGATVTRWTLLMPDADGKAIPATTLKYAHAIASESVATGENCRVMLIPPTYFA